ncbi:acetoacetate--CoA ligase [Rhodococcus opacus]|uniref:Acetoacetate--CoA ligase n=1 Tax=Rhodococcus opacus TaxID=37919 RepID=A0AAX3YVI0_RHOOP|nr:acetoacetate--CoA ligase [Rhodococcus opacus]MCZ4590373.1 acetoacetate--CoA ligase [Rhodococcus opacus]WLF51629.1 acetoacetate--CoA ligase [Rhodococcus opacus]WLF52574.1 acetoacetate--CoA ligase [Rhodococcus opacus]
MDFGMDATVEVSSIGPGDIAWSPSAERIADARISDFIDWLQATGRFEATSYQSLWDWSVTSPEEFWASMKDYFGVTMTGVGPVLATREMPFAHWFPGRRLNYVDMVLSHAQSSRPAIIDDSEPGGPGPRTVSWTELARQVTALANWLRARGVGEGDCVVGYLPNIAEAVIAFLATASVGATWSCCGQDYQPEAVVDRLGQLAPVVLVTADGYRFGGREVDRLAALPALQAGMPTLRQVLVVDRLHSGTSVPAGTTPWVEAVTGGGPAMTPAHVRFDHPLWVLFSSGTTGKPKGFVHGHGGVVLEHLKALALHLDLGPSDTYLWYTSPSWMVWNSLVSGLLVGATIVCYDGSPSYPTDDALWALTARHEVTVLGTSPAYLQACARAGRSPGTDHDLSRLRTIGATGSVVAPELHSWVADHVGRDVPLASVTGGTDVASGFAGFVPILPVRAGEISAPYLGVALDSWDADGRSLRDAVGELVVTQPMPSMPTRFWNDGDGARYRETYFESYPGVWRHGDWVTITERNTVIVHGRSDSTLNRNGIRFGTADIYRVVEELPEVEEALVIGAEQQNGEYWMPLFVALSDHAELDDALRGRIAGRIREAVSPRVVPDDVIVVRAIPHTRTGKKLEVPVKRILQGNDVSAVAEARSIDDPSLLETFARYAATRAANSPVHGA